MRIALIFNKQFEKAKKIKFLLENCAWQTPRSTHVIYDGICSNLRLAGSDEPCKYQGALVKQQICWKGSPCPKPVVDYKSNLEEWFHAGLKIRAWHYNLGDPSALTEGWRGLCCNTALQIRHVPERHTQRRTRKVMLENTIYKQRSKEMWIFNPEKRKSNRADGSSNMKRHHREVVLAACRGWGMGGSGKGS